MGGEGLGLRRSSSGSSAKNRLRLSNRQDGRRSQRRGRGSDSRKAGGKRVLNAERSNSSSKMKPKDLRGGRRHQQEAREETAQLEEIRAIKAQAAAGEQQDEQRVADREAAAEMKLEGGETEETTAEQSGARGQTEKCVSRVSRLSMLHLNTPQGNQMLIATAPPSARLITTSSARVPRPGRTTRTTRSFSSTGDSFGVWALRQLRMPAAPDGLAALFRGQTYTVNELAKRRSCPPAAS